MRLQTTLTIALLLCALVIACDEDSSSGSTAVPATNASPQVTANATTGSASGLPQGSDPIDLQAEDFVAQIDNPFWPMKPGNHWVYTETNADGTVVQVDVTVTSDTKVISGINATVVHDVVTEDGAVIEDTLDWYAQDTDGNVWYMGEDTKEYEDGEVVSTAGSWEHGVDGALAGIIMPANPAVGMLYRQEYYAGEAEDRAEVLSISEQVEVPFGTYEDALQTEDTTPLEPDVLEHKYYARGVGPVLAVDVAGGGREELTLFEEGP